MSDTTAQNQHRQQLRMIWPTGKVERPKICLPENYALRLYRDSDTAGYLELMHEAGFTDFHHESLEKMKKTLLPDAFFLVEHKPDRTLVATAMANHQPIDPYPRAGAVNWVAGAKMHSGKGLGKVVVAAALNRLLDCGYADIYLTTDDFRLPALKTYLQLGFLPDMFNEEMPERWKLVCLMLNWQL